jgi:hypothetical protein
MKKVTILPVSEGHGHTSYCAVADDKQSVGKTAGEALDSLTLQFSNEDMDSLVVIQNMRPDSFFDADNLRQLTELMARWRTARDSGQTLSEDEQTRLNTLIEEELQASSQRAAAVSEKLNQ